MISKKGMESDIKLLELATGIKDSLTKAGFTTINFILSSSTATDISKKLGIDLYVAQIIFEEAKKIRDVVTADTATTVNKDSDSNNNNNYLLSIQ